MHAAKFLSQCLRNMATQLESRLIEVVEALAANRGKTHCFLQHFGFPSGRPLPIFTCIRNGSPLRWLSRKHSVHFHEFRLSSLTECTDLVNYETRLDFYTFEGGRTSGGIVLEMAGMAFLNISFTFLELRSHTTTNCMWSSEIGYQ